MSLTEAEITAILRQKHRHTRRIPQTPEQRRASKAKWERDRYARDAVFREAKKAKGRGKVNRRVEE